MVGLTLVASAGSVVAAIRAGPEVVATASGESQAPATTTTVTTTTTTAAQEPEDEPAAVPPCRPAGAAEQAQLADGDPLDDWATIVVDPTNALPRDFVPPDLVEVSLRPPQGEIMIREIVAEDLEKMLAGARSNGTPLTLVSGYRSYDYQLALYQDEVQDLGEEAAAATTAKPGHSEHQLGTAVDVLAPGSAELTAAFGETPAGKWVARNAHRYGFVISYPKGAEHRACYDYEPWHLRYVGRDFSRQIVRSGLAPREWMLTHA